MEAVGVIPARYRSVRFPGKILADLQGMPVVQHVYLRARKAESLTQLVVATDDERICQVVRGFGGEAMLTSKDHSSGTDRLAEVAVKLPAALYVNIQGDEPLVDARDIDRLVESLRSDPNLEMATMRRRIEDEADLRNPNVVKVVVDASGEALYFSRSPIPFKRGEGKSNAYRHIGLYGYRRELLLEIAARPVGDLEKAEQLEQLRVLEMGRRIRVLDAVGESVGVDTPEDLERVRAILGESVR
ncbi:MAG: 3-deoxy-manno-octulosonate cytidylyltransferase [Acidobacteria bacterium]|nr:3-deoxy-manno-octulosonate cytidylyltransferase [Acidobacteriota bacterium]